MSKTFHFLYFFFNFSGLDSWIFNCWNIAQQVERHDYKGSETYAGSNPAVPVNNMAVNYYSVPKLLKCGGNLAGNSTTLRCGNSNIANPHSLVGSLSKVTQSCGFLFCRKRKVE